MSAINGIFLGDSLQIIRTVSNVPTGETIVKAWFTLKVSANDTDANAKLQKIITESTSAGVGVITDNVAGSSASLRFDIGGTDWDLLRAGKTYRYDIQVKTSGGGIYTPEDGTFLAKPEIDQGDGVMFGASYFGQLYFGQGASTSVTTFSAIQINRASIALRTTQQSALPLRLSQSNAVTIHSTHTASDSIRRLA